MEGRRSYPETDIFFAATNALIVPNRAAKPFLRLGITEYDIEQAMKEAFQLIKNKFELLPTAQKGSSKK